VEAIEINFKDQGMIPYLRRFTSDDWALFKTMRLEALETEAYFFGGRFVIESAMTDEEWQARVANPHAAFWGLFDGDECIGLTGIIQDKAEPEKLVMIASYMRAPYRRRGLSALFYEARIAWAREHGYGQIHVAHRQGNTASQAAIMKYGFTYTHTEQAPWPDGTVDGKLCYQLSL